MKILYLVNGISKTSIPWRWSEYFNKHSRGSEIEILTIKSFMKRLWSLKRKRDVVHGHHIKSMALFTLVNFLLRIKSIYTVHGSYRFLSKTNALLLRFIFRFSDKIVFVNQILYDVLPESYKRNIEGKYEIILNGVEINYKYKKIDIYEKFNIDRTDIICFHPARFVIEKNHIRLITAIKPLIEKNSKLKLVLAGNGELQDEIEFHVKKLKLEKNIIFLGLIERDEVYNFLEHCELFLMPSISEGLNVAFLEAISMKTKIVVSDIEQFTYPLKAYNLESKLLNITFVDPLDEDSISRGIGSTLKQKRNLEYNSAEFSLESMMNGYKKIYIGKALNSFSKNKLKFKMIPDNGGRIFAFIGGDGAGKSSNIKKLVSTLNQNYVVEGIHIGRPNQSGEPKRYFIGRQVYNMGRLLVKLGIKHMGDAISFIGVAIQRKQAFMRAKKIKSEGGIVILDRIPLEGVITMDGPRIEKILEGKPKFLSYIEKKIYHSIKGIDGLIVLKLNPKIALKRRPEDEEKELLMRSAQVWEYDFSKMKNTIVIDTENSFKYVEDKILTFVLNSIRNRRVISELVGLPGTGKSTSKRLLVKNYPNITFFLKKEKKGIYILQYISLYLNIYLQAKQYKYLLLTSAIKIDITLNNFKKGNYIKNQQIVLDQGPIYLLTALITNLPQFEDIFLKRVSTLAQYYDRIIFLEAPLSILLHRINSREQKHEIKNRKEHIQREFLEKRISSFEKILKVCELEGVEVYRIDTDKNSQQIVKELIDEILQK